MKPKNFLLSYNLFICLTFLIFGVLNAHQVTDLALSFLFFPLVLHFILSLLRQISFWSKPAIKNQRITPTLEVKTNQPITPEEIKGIADVDRRLFLKLIGSAGISVFMMALFTKKAQAAFFGSVPGPGTISIKDIAGNKIDPAEKQPTDGYALSEIDDDGGAIAYFGFVNINGAWYIMKETDSNTYRYTKGSSNFSTNWTNRASLTYDYFDVVFG